MFTVFSTSKDHRQGAKAMAGCILVDFDKVGGCGVLYYKREVERGRVELRSVVLCSTGQRGGVYCSVV